MELLRGQVVLVLKEPLLLVQALQEDALVLLVLEREDCVPAALPREEHQLPPVDALVRALLTLDAALVLIVDAHALFVKPALLAVSGALREYGAEDLAGLPGLRVDLGLRHASHEGRDHGGYIAGVAGEVRTLREMECDMS